MEAFWLHSFALPVSLERKITSSSLDWSNISILMLVVSSRMTPSKSPGHEDLLNGLLRVNWIKSYALPSQSPDLNLINYRKRNLDRHVKQCFLPLSSSSKNLVDFVEGSELFLRIVPWNTETILVACDSQTPFKVTLIFHICVKFSTKYISGTIKEKYYKLKQVLVFM